MVEVKTWAEIKDFADIGTALFYTQSDSQYKIFTSDLFYMMDKDPTDTTDLDDFEDNYKSNCNKKPLTEIDGEVTPKTIKNEHTIEPWGAKAGFLKGSDYACEITLSNKSEDGLTFNYSIPVGKTLAVGNYVFQNYFTKHVYITAFTETTVTFSDDFQDELDNGVGVYSKGYYIDCEVPDWKSNNFLWGMVISVFKVGTEVLPLCRHDFVELSIIDRNHLLEDEDFVYMVFGCDMDEIPYVLAAYSFEWSEEFGGCWAKYYDESNASSYINKGEIKTPDGSPGALIPFLWVRFAWFTTDITEAEYEFKIDHIPTSKEI